MSIDSAEPPSVAVIVPVVRPEQRAVAEAVVRSLADLAELAVLDNAEGEPASAHATWLRAAEVVPAHGTGPGRGEAIWKGLFATRGKVVVVIAPETPDPAGVLRAVTAPFAADDSLGMVCGVGPTEAEVNRLLARPLLALHAPQLADLRDPTSQEWAVRRDLVEMLPLSVGAGVDLALRLDVENLEGRAAILEVDLPGAAAPDLTPVTTAQLVSAVERRMPVRMALPDEPIELPGVAGSVPVHERPPVASVPGYATR